jgi:hypothetical protein
MVAAQTPGALSWAVLPSGIVGRPSRVLSSTWSSLSGMGGGWLLQVLGAQPRRDIPKNSLGFKCSAAFYRLRPLRRRQNWRVGRHAARRLAEHASGRRWPAWKSTSKSPPSQSSVVNCNDNELLARDMAAGIPLHDPEILDSKDNLVAFCAQT